MNEERRIGVDQAPTAGAEPDLRFWSEKWHMSFEELRRIVDDEVGTTAKRPVPQTDADPLPK